MNAPKFCSSCSCVNETFPIGACTFPALSTQPPAIEAAAESGPEYVCSPQEAIPESASDR